MSNKRYYVYIMASRSKNLYTGITNDVYRRAMEHKAWTRAKRVALIETLNPTWQDLSEGWGEPIDYSQLQIPRSARDDTRVEGKVRPRAMEPATVGNEAAAGAPEGALLQNTFAAVAAKPEDESE